MVVGGDRVGADTCGCKACGYGREKSHCIERGVCIEGDHAGWILIVEIRGLGVRKSQYKRRSFLFMKREQRGDARRDAAMSRDGTKDISFRCHGWPDVCEKRVQVAFR